MPCAVENGVDHPAEDIPLEELPGEAPRLSPTGGAYTPRLAVQPVSPEDMVCCPAYAARVSYTLGLSSPPNAISEALWSIEWLRVYIALVIQSVWGSTARSRADGYMVGRQETFIPMTT